MMNAMDPTVMKIFSGATPGAANIQKFWISVGRLQANTLKAALRYNAEAISRPQALPVQPSQSTYSTP